MNNVAVNDFNENEFWVVIKKNLKAIGREFAFKVFQLYYALRSENVPTKQKMVIVGALAYLILPVDAIPDFIPVYGWTDDAAVISAALLAVIDAIDDDINAQATRMCDELFGSDMAAAA